MDSTDDKLIPAGNTAIDLRTSINLAKENQIVVIYPRFWLLSHM